MKSTQDSRLFRLVSHSLKYFLLALVGFAIAYILSINFGAAHITAMLLPLLLDVIWRLGLILFCIIALTVITESLR